MKNKFGILSCIILSIILLQGNKGIEVTIKHIIPKKNGNIILGHKAFEDFLKSDKSWNSFKSILLEPYPSMLKVHKRQIEWGELDTSKFSKEVSNFKIEEFEKFMNQYDLKTINYLYDSVIEKANKILPPFSNKKVDLCFFLPYGGGCFVIPEDSLNTIYISMYINPEFAEKIMAHEYAHILHIGRKPKEALTLKREIVSEGIAVYLTTLIMKNIEVSNSIPFMSQEAFAWCLKNEQLIKDSIYLDLNDTTNHLFKRYISDGSWAEPPKGFVQKTGYFIGYRIIESCMRNGMKLEEICSLESEAVIKKSGYFK